MNAYTLVVGRGAERAGDRCGRQQGPRGRCFRSPTRRRRCWSWARKNLIGHIKTIGLFRNKAKNVMKLSRILVEGLRRRGSILARSPSVAARRGAQDRECGAQHVVGPSRAGRGHAYLPRGKPRRHRSGQGRGRGRARHRGQRTRGVSAPRPSLADPARPLHLRRAQAEMPRLPDPGPLRLRGQDARDPAETREKGPPA